LSKIHINCNPIGHLKPYNKTSNTQKTNNKQLRIQTMKYLCIFFRMFGIKYSIKVAYFYEFLMLQHTLFKNSLTPFSQAQSIFATLSHFIS